MNDGVTKGTGNSRYLKTVSNFLTLYPTYAEFAAALIAGTLPVDFNGINATGWTAIATALNKGNLLSDAVCAALGIPTTSVPNDAFSKLSGAVNPLQYVWEKYLISGNLTNGTNGEKILVNINSPSTTYVITYSDSAYIKLDGTIGLQNPSTFDLSYNNYASYLNTLNGKYFTTSMSPSTVYLGTADALTRTIDVTQYLVKKIAAQVSVSGFSKTLIGQVASYNETEYPQDGTQGGYYYKYLSRPQYIGAQISTGYYTGTGTYGSGSPVSIPTSGQAKLFIVSKVDNNEALGASIISGYWITGMSYLSNGSSASTCSVTSSSSSISYYSSTNTQYQFNSNGVVYKYAYVY